MGFLTAWKYSGMVWNRTISSRVAENAFWVIIMMKGSNESVGERCAAVMSGMELRK
jgi:hypothetical protein